MRHSESEIQLISSSLLFTLHSCTMFFMNTIYGNLTEWGPVTMLANSAGHHSQSISPGTAHSGTPSRLCWNVGVLLYAENTTVIVFYVCLNHLEFLLFIAPYVHVLFLIASYRKKKIRHKVTGHSVWNVTRREIRKIHYQLLHNLHSCRITHVYLYVCGNNLSVPFLTN
jgi:hypothetical protein